MNIVSRLTIGASFAAAAAVACTSLPEEPASVDVDTDQLGARCIKGGVTCGPTGASAGGVTGGVGTSGTVSTSSSGGGGVTGGTSGKLSSSGLLTSGGTLAPETPEPASCGENSTTAPSNARTTGGCDPVDCGEWCQWDREHVSCSCIGVGYGLASSITCPVAHPCGREVRGVVRCYDYLPGGVCAP